VKYPDDLVEKVLIPVFMTTAICGLLLLMFDGCEFRVHIDSKPSSTEVTP
jgi:hypothetical protein